MLLQLKLATKGFVSQHDEEEIDSVKSSDLDELDDEEEETDEEEENDEKESSKTKHDKESNEELDDRTEIFGGLEDYSSDFFC